MTGVQRTTENIDPGIEHTPCRNEKRITEYKMKDVTNKNDPEMDQSSVEIVF